MRAPPRSRLQRWLFALAIFLAAHQIFSFVLVLNRSEGMIRLTSLNAPFESIASLVWGLTWARTGWALRSNRPKSIQWALWLTLAFVAYRIAHVAIFARADYDRGRLPFLILLLTISSFITGYLLRQYNTHIREKEHGCKSQN